MVQFAALRLPLQFDVLDSVGEVLANLLTVVSLLQARQLLSEDLDHLRQHLQRNTLTSGLVEKDVVVENLHKELDLYERIHALFGDLQTFLETIQHFLAVLGWFPLSGLAGSRPEEVTDGEDPATLVRLLQEVGRCQGTLRPEGGVVLL